MISREVSKSLWKLGATALASASLFALFIFDRESPFAGLAIGLVVLVLFPSMLLFAIDTSRVIRKEARTNASVKVLGYALGIPQLLIGAFLMAFGVVYPVSIFIKGLGPTPLMTAPYVGYAMLMFSVGFYYTREGLWLVGLARTHRKEKIVRGRHWKGS
jgi:hypothetical protein